MGFVAWIMTHTVELVELWFGVIGVATIIVKLTPTLKDEHILKGIVRFTGKYLALNRK